MTTMEKGSGTEAALDPGMTTTRARFIEEARERGELFVEQPYHLYSEANHETWRRLYGTIEPMWRRYAHPQFQVGLDRLALNSERIPRLDEINRFLEPLSAFQSKAVSGYVPAFLFFDCLRRREFPTTITIRDGKTLAYLPEPDIFHDLAGHVPMHTDRKFSDILVKFGDVAHTAAESILEVEAGDRRLRAVESVIKAMARFFWFTIEFGLMRRPGSEELCAYGSGLLSSIGELEHSVTAPGVQRFPFRLEWVVNQYFEIHHFQPLLFWVEDFEHLYHEVHRLERWVAEGRLYNVSPGEPEINEDDLQSFLRATV